jgi:hypothetical protein
MHTLALLAVLLGQTTPNMSLVESTPGVTSPYQTQVNDQTNFLLIDAHNHTSGKGVAIPPAGININAPLPFNGNPATTLGYTGLVDAGNGPSIPISLWNDGTNFWVEDGLGNKIELTCNGGICVSISGLDGGSITITNLTVNNTFNGPTGVGIGSGCLTSTSGAKMCFDAYGGIAVYAVDGGQVLVQTGGPNYLLMSRTTNYTPSATTVGSLASLAGIAVDAGNPVSYDLANNGTTIEMGPNIVTHLPLGGTFVVDAGGGNSGWPFEILYNNDIRFEVGYGGTTSIGSNSGDVLTLLPEIAGSKAVWILAASNADTNVDLQLEAQGTGEIAMRSPVGTLSGPVIINADAGLQIGNLGNETPIVHSHFITVDIPGGAGGQNLNGYAIESGSTAVCNSGCSNTPCICGSSSCSLCTNFGVKNYGNTLGTLPGDTCTVGGPGMGQALIVNGCYVDSPGVMLITQQQLVYDAGWNGGVFTCECNAH